ncbi:nuclear transport factor 2 family protein [Pricia sp. S334]|uniref:Nuclear transport factor 2 family protein n=1 Tax=Pricia mediterranea TaxID=3076079 RepID=A0ABU3L126_9FLAO|nr:nuclear transport factor 2 family protein [Pricia sp. S334]MDT7827325.1 nuclear transport factor 2 family protein [Pricia sp. S334]
MKAKNTLFVLAFLSLPALFAQKKTNGKIYIEHPAINVVQNFVKASVAGDTTQLVQYMAEDFTAYNGTSDDPLGQSMDQEAYIRNVMLYHDQLDYYSIEPFPGSYPDALEYKEREQENLTTVLTWNQVKGVHKTTGVKIDAAAHRQYDVTKDDKIKRIITYSNGGVIDEIRASFADRTNGTIYNHHDNINTVRKMVYALEKGDMEKVYSFFDKDARFGNLSSFKTRGVSLEEQKALDKKVLEQFEIKHIEMSGYPDYLEYEMDNGRVVQSWWNFQLIRKSDKMAIELPMFYLHDFDGEGKIIREAAYYNEKLMEQPVKVASN